MARTYILIGLIPVVLVTGFFAFNSYIFEAKQPEVLPEPYQASLSGELVCLPKVGDGPHTMECAYGIRTDNGEYYAVVAQTPPETGERFSANGMVTPIERLSGNQWQQYDIKGVFSVTDKVEPREEEVFCTQDVQMCPDGSYVSRQGPNCEFAACPDGPVACTMDAKLCPDGSVFGRQGPNCEFPLCPGEESTE